MILGLSGKIGSGKDTVSKIIQYLTHEYEVNGEVIQSYSHFLKLKYEQDAFDFKIKKFAGKLKQIVSLLTGISVEDLEKEEIKNKLLGEDWTRYGIADGFWYHSSDNPSMKIMHNSECSKEKYEEELRTNWQTAYKQEYTPRLLLQYIGTDLFRDKILQNIWVNALFSDFKSLNNNWIISDLRFPNEFDAIKVREGLCIRINRNSDNKSNHISETSLDHIENWDWVINNDGSIEDLIEEVKKMLIHFKILQ